MTSWTSIKRIGDQTFKMAQTYVQYQLKRVQDRCTRPPKSGAYSPNARISDARIPEACTSLASASLAHASLARTSTAYPCARLSQRVHPCARYNIVRTRVS